MTNQERILSSDEWKEVSSELSELGEQIQDLILSKSKKLGVLLVLDTADKKNLFSAHKLEWSFIVNPLINLDDPKWNQDAYKKQGVETQPLQ